MTNAKPVTREWLYQKYVVEQLGTTQIAKLVNRHPTRVHDWLVNEGIPTRKKWHGNIPERRKHHDAEWLATEYGKGRTLAEIGEECHVTANTILNYMRRYGIATQSTIERRVLRGTLSRLSGEANPMYGKRGAEVPSWKGGCTPERQAFYSSEEWARACSLVWKRDAATCQKCGQVKTDEAQEYHIHHIVSFSHKELRAEPSNLVLLCAKCHRWVHSKRNMERLFLGDATNGNSTSL